MLKKLLQKIFKVNPSHVVENEAMKERILKQRAEEAKLKEEMLKQRTEEEIQRLKQDIVEHLMAAFRPKTQEELEYLTHGRSELFHNFHEQRVKRYDFYNMDTIKNTEDLTSLEKSFLHYITGLNALDLGIPAYWTFDYGIDYKYTIDMLFSNGYIDFFNYNNNFNKYTLVELKDLLRYFNLKVSGNKEVLINRIIENISEDVLESYFENSNKLFICLTDKGRKALNGYVDSATKDISYENIILTCIENRRFQEAQKFINKYQNKLPRPHGEEEYHSFKLPEHTLEAYNQLLDKSTQNNDEITIRYIIIFCHLTGLGIRNCKKLLNRLIQNKEKLPELQEHFEVQMSDFYKMLQKMNLERSGLPENFFDLDENEMDNLDWE